MDIVSGIIAQGLVFHVVSAGVLCAALGYSMSLFISGACWLVKTLRPGGASSAS